MVVGHDVASQNTRRPGSARRSRGPARTRGRASSGGVSLGSEADIGTGVVDAAKQADEYAAFGGSRRCHFVRNDDSRRGMAIF
ncbi:Uncharacterised protein [Acinetobacter baumannii]|nr:Uncharacterised protein [Acinetobacter baumannii]